MSGVVPDDVDAETLHQRIHSTSSTPPEERKTCPHCGSISLSPRPQAEGHDWYCECCAGYATDQEVEFGR